MVLSTSREWISLTFPGFPVHNFTKFPDYFQSENQRLGAIDIAHFNGLKYCSELCRIESHLLPSHP